MKKIDLSSYKDYKQYFNFFDVLIKQKNSNKDLFLDKISIAPSSYRKAKKLNNKNSQLIFGKLCDYFNFKPIEDNVICHVEKLINSVYVNIYYKNNHLLDKDLENINILLKDNFIIYPILNLFKVLILLSDSKSKPNNILIEYKELIDDVISFECFYTEDLKEILELIKVLMYEKLNEKDFIVQFENELIYHILSTKCLLEKKYFEGIYYAKIAKEKFINNENYYRVYYTNLTLMSCYNHLLKFREAYDLSLNQLRSLELKGNNDFEYGATRLHFVIACLNLNKYDEAISILEQANKINFSEFCCLLIALFFVDKKQYDCKVNEFLEKNITEEIKNTVIHLNEYLLTNRKSEFFELESAKINDCIIAFLKKCKK